MSEKEQRETERTPVVLEATWSGSTVGSPVRVTDISMGGCYLDTIGRAEPGESVLISLILAEGKLVTLSGIATYAQTHTGFGVRFTNLSEEQSELIAGLLAKSGDD